MDITSMTAVELGKRIQAGELSAVEAVKASLAQIDRVEASVHGFVTVDREGALRRAEEVLLQAYRRQLRIISVQRTCPPHAVPEYWRILNQLSRQRR